MVRVMITEPKVVVFMVGVQLRTSAGLQTRPPRPKDAPSGGPGGDGRRAASGYPDPGALRQSELWGSAWRISAFYIMYTGACGYAGYTYLGVYTHM